MKITHAGPTPKIDPAAEHRDASSAKLVDAPGTQKVNLTAHDQLDRPRKMAALDPHGRSPALAIPPPVAVSRRINPADLYDKVLDIKTGELLEHDAFFARIREARVIYVSETHDNPAHHALQLRLLAQLCDHNPKLALVMEFLYRSSQPVIDAYTRGELSYEEFADKVRFGFGSLYPFYEEIIQYAAGRQHRLIGMNVEKEIKRKLLEVGWENLSLEEQKLVARELDMSDPAYRAYLQQVIEQSMGEMPPPVLERMMKLQAIWDETFGETIANYLRDANDPEAQALVIVGSGHVRFKFNTPEKSCKRFAAPYVTVVPVETNADYPVDLGEIRRSAVADFVFFSDFSPEQTQKVAASAPGRIDVADAL